MPSDIRPSIFIPARMESTRFPGKPLAPIDGIPMIVYIAKNAADTNFQTYVCTDSREIAEVCKLYSIDVILTPEFTTGTDRVAWASVETGSDFSINLQGDEPLITTDKLSQFIGFCLDNYNENYTYNALSRVGSIEAFDPNNVKCVFSSVLNKILYFSRCPLSSALSEDIEKPYFKQLGLYAMSSLMLKQFSSSPQTPLELTERVELMRLIENGHHVVPYDLDVSTISVDTPDDFIKVLDSLSIRN